VPGRARCEEGKCGYFFEVFSKRDKGRARQFYLAQPSKGLKYLMQAEDKRWFVAFGGKTEAFVVESIYDLIDPKALQIIQIGLSDTLKRPISIMARLGEKCRQSAAPHPIITVIEKDGQLFGRVDPRDPQAYYCEYCKKIRESEKGRQRCLDFDAGVMVKMFAKDEPKSEWYPCWGGMIDLAIPVIINRYVVAVFYGGQVLWTDTEGQKLFAKRSVIAAEFIGGEPNALAAIAGGKNQVKSDRRDLDQRLKHHEEEVQIIQQVADSRYWAERRVREAEFMSEVFAYFATVDDEASLWTVLANIIKRLGEFAFFRYAGLLMNETEAERSFVVRVAGGFGKDTCELLELEHEEIQKVFCREGLFVVKDVEGLVEHRLYEKVTNVVGVRDLNCVLMLPYTLSTGQRYILLLADRLAAIHGQEPVGYVSDQRSQFLEAVGHEIKVEIDSWFSIRGLERAIAEKDDLLASAGHVLVAPLDGIYGKTEHLVTLASVGEPSKLAANADKIKRLSESIDRDVMRAVRQTRSFLMFTRGKMASEPYKLDQSISLTGLVEECCADFTYLAMKRGITINLDAPPNLPSAYFDREKLMIAFSNLLDNAVKYSYPRRSIEVCVSLQKDLGVYLVTVGDFGKGIPEPELEKVFERYYRSKWEDPKRFIPGTGIGLTVAKEIINRHKGRMWATSTQGQSQRGAGSLVGGYSTIFWIELPRRSRPI
jgi:signal transduction histidine kinase